MRTSLCVIALLGCGLASRAAAATWSDYSPYDGTYGRWAPAEQPQSAAQSVATPGGGAALPPAGAIPGALYGTDGTTLYRIDKVTGAATAIGSHGIADSFLGDIAFDRCGTLYGLSLSKEQNNTIILNAQLYTIDPTTGAATAIGPLDGNVYEGALSFSPSGQLFGANAGHAVGDATAFTLDKSTGAATIIGSPSTRDLNGFAFDGATLYAIDDPTNTLGTVDPTTGVYSSIGNVGVVIGATGGLAIDPADGALYATFSGSGMGTGGFYHLNKATGAATFIAASTVVDGLAFAPLSCDDGNPCSIDGCNAATGQCTHSPAPSSIVCRSAAGVCDVAENCTGASINCPGDGFAASGTICRTAAGACDMAEVCTGSSATCPADVLRPSGFTCRAAAGVCDVAESCTGGSASCPVDVFQPSTTVCRPAAGACDTAESCTGSSAACPADVLKSSGTVCRSSAGVCDVAETCTGGSASCPTDVFQPSTTVCRTAAGVCDTAESCTGSSAACPADLFKSPATVCRPSAGICDVAESCTGSSAACPADVLKSGTVCRSSAGVCDVAEICTGASAGCPVDVFEASTTVCRPAAGVCDTAESCTGSSAACPTDLFKSPATVCRPSAGICDVAESCTGGSASCPADVLQSSATVCRPAAGICDTPESCTGSAAACPQDAFKSPATVCRASAGECDLAETCTGTAAACPGDLVKGSGTACTDDGNLCTLDQCDGAGVTCAHTSNPACACGNGTVEADNNEQCDAGAANGTLASCCTATCQLRAAGQTCRPSAGICDTPETCTGSSASCPADGFQPSTTVCRPAAGACDDPESCTGVSPLCPADVFQPSTTVCRAAAGVCDVAESCTGISASCPTDVFAPSTTTCRPAAGECDLAELCTGDAAACPGNAVKGSGVACTDDGNLCTLDQCDSASVTCSHPSNPACACGNGIVEPDNNEQCDAGAANGAATSCCTATCQLRAAGQTCRPSAGICDAPEACTGNGAACPADVFLPSTTTCRPAAGECDVAETCTGSGAACPGDVLKGGGTPCTDDGNTCTLDQCTGASVTCAHPSNPACACGNGTVEPDNNEECDAGAANGAPTSCCTVACKLRAAGETCRAIAGVCDEPEACTGNTPTCPADGFLPSATVCRPAAGVCDVPESCSGSAAACPADAFLASTTTCRPAADVCDDPESCTGTSAACPADAFQPSTTICRPAAGECDLAETCTGTGSACPIDAVKGGGTACTDDGNLCTLDRCDGTGVTCAHTSNPACACGNGTVEPDNGEQCDGGATNGAATSCCTAACQLRAAGQTCRTSAGICDVAETCTGAAPSCPADAFAASTVECRPAAGVCDSAETCTGSSPTCPGDVVKASGVACPDDGNACTLDQCDGTTVACGHPANPACACGNGTVDVDNQEQCDAGSANGRPTSCCTLTCTFRAAGQVCRPSAGECDVAETCSGSAGDCPADVRAADGATCADGVFCNGTDTCAGGTCSAHTGNPCPGPDGDGNCAETCSEAAKACTAPDPDGSTCTDGDQCTVGDACSAGTCAGGTAVTCPAGQLCNPSTGICGASATCAASCDDDNPCTTDTCDPSQGKCVSVAVTDGQGCEDADECTTGAAVCAAGTCGVRNCEVDVMQVVENGVPEPTVEVDCQLFARKHNGAVKNGTCVAQLLDATGRAPLAIGLPARRKRPQSSALSATGRARIKNGHATLRLTLNARGKQLLDATGDGVLVVEVRSLIKAKGTRARISKLLAVRRP